MGVDHIIPTNSYLMTRGSRTWGQTIFWRNYVRNSLNALGPILTGIIPFFKNTGSRSTYSSIVSVITNPVAKGFDLIAPDETVGQLGRLDEQALRDNLIVPNNSQVRTVTFISKESVKLCNTSANGTGSTSQTQKSDNSCKENSDDPIQAMKALGTMVLIGDRIQHVNRIRVISTPVSQLPSATSVNPDTVTQGTQVPLAISGSFLQNAKVTGPKGFTITNTKVDDKGTSITLTLNVDKDVTPNDYMLTITTAGGQTSIPLKVIGPVVKPKGPEVSLDPATLSFENQKVQTVKVTNTGNEPLTGISTTMDGANKDDFKATQDSACDKGVDPEKNCTISVTFTPKGKGSSNATLMIKDNANDSPQSVNLKGTIK